MDGWAGWNVTSGVVECHVEMGPCGGNQSPRAGEYCHMVRLPLPPHKRPRTKDGTATDRVYDTIYRAVLEHRLALANGCAGRTGQRIQVSRGEMRQAMQRRRTR
jgi:hypothetical protein